MPRGTRRSARRSAPAAAKAAEAAENESSDAAQDVPASDHDDENETAGDETVHQSLAHLLTTLSKPEDLLTTILMPAVAQSDGGGGGDGGGAAPGRRHRGRDLCEDRLSRFASFFEP